MAQIRIIAPVSRREIFFSFVCLITSVTSLWALIWNCSSFFITGDTLKPFFTAIISFTDTCCPSSTAVLSDRSVPVRSVILLLFELLEVLADFFEFILSFPALSADISKSLGSAGISLPSGSADIPPPLTVKPISSEVIAHWSDR